MKYFFYTQNYNRIYFYTLNVMDVIKTKNIISFFLSSEMLYKHEKIQDEIKS